MGTSGSSIKVVGGVGAFYAQMNSISNSSMFFDISFPKVTQPWVGAFYAPTNSISISLMFYDISFPKDTH